MHRCFKPQTGFTLIEVVMAVMLLALLAGVLFAVVAGTLEAAGQVSTRQLQVQEFNGLAEVCRSTFQTLDGEARFTAKVVPAPGGGFVQEMTIAGAPLAFAWSGAGVERGTTVVAPRPQANGLLAFCLMHQAGEETGSGETVVREMDKNPKWFVLVRDLKRMEWRFFDGRAREWRKEWEEETVRPSLVELTVNTAALPDDVRMVFPVLAATRGSVTAPTPNPVPPT